jgi:hypothetical protein
MKESSSARPFHLTAAGGGAGDPLHASIVSVARARKFPRLGGAFPQRRRRIPVIKGKSRANRNEATGTKLA